MDRNAGAHVPVRATWAAMVLGSAAWGDDNEGLIAGADQDAVSSAVGGCSETTQLLKSAAMRTHHAGAWPAINP